MSLDQTNIIAVIITIILAVILIHWRRGSGPASASPVSAPAPPTPPPPGSPAPPTPPAPAPAVSPRSYVWIWWIIIIIAAVLIGRWIWYEGRSASTPPQATTPKPQLRQYVVKRNLKFVGGDGAFEKEGLVGVRNGRAFFVTNDLPWRKDAVFHVAVRLRQQTTGNITLVINGGRGGEKFYLVPGSSEFGNAVFFDSGEIGRPEYFNPGTNQIILSSHGDGTIIQRVSIEMIYYE